MTLWKLMYPRWKGFPPVTLCLALGCLLVSIPVLLWPQLYWILGYNDEAVNHFWQAITSSFAHGTLVNSNPAPLPHLIGNFLIIILLGALIERVLGSGRFFLLTLATLATHTIWKVTVGGGNGASGFCWGYVVIAAPIFVWEWQRRRNQVFKDPLYLGMVCLSAFMVVGVPTVLWFQGYHELWKHGSNQAHLVSVLTALPFVYLWWKVMRANWEKLQNNEPIDHGRPLLNAAAIVTSLLLLGFNLTFAAIGMEAVRTGSLSMPRVVSMTPENGDLAALNEYDRQVTIRFDRPMASELEVQRVSISWLDEPGKLDYSFHWQDTQTLVCVFSREVYEGESILVSYKVRDARWNMTIPFEIQYQ